MNDLLERLAAGTRPYLLLTLLCLVLHAAGIAALPPLDRDEARFAQATKQMVETGDYVVIRFQDEPRNKKPVGIHWLQAAALTVLPGASHDAIWAYRVPSAVAAWAAVLLTFALGARLFDRRIALLGAGLLGASVLLQGEAHQAKTDATLLLAVVAAQWALVRIWTAARAADGPGAPVRPPPDWPAFFTFWLALGAGILLKGPIAPLVLALTVVALALTGDGRRRFAGLKPLIGVPLMLAVPLPWGMAIALSDTGFFSEAVGHDLLGKVTGGQESHGAPPGVYLAALAVAFWPGSLLLPPAAVVAWRERAVPAVRFCLCWLLPCWLLFELVPTKLPHYVLPLYPALALLTAHAVVDAVEWRRLFTAAWARAWYVVWAVLGLAVGGALLYVAGRFGGGVGPAALLGAAFAAAAGVVPAVFAWRARFGRAIAAALAGAVLFEAWLLQAVAPGMETLWLSRAVAAEIARLQPMRVEPVAATGFREPSLVFALGTDTRLVPAEEVARLLLERPGRLALVEARQREAFVGTLALSGAVPERVGGVRGFNYSSGKAADIGIYRLPPPAPGATEGGAAEGGR